MSAFLGYAEAQGWIEVPLLPRKGAATLAPSGAPRERVLADAEICALWAITDREAPRLRAFVRLMILTAAREFEVAGMAAGEVDLAAGRWALPAGRTKSRRGYIVPLCKLAVVELRAVWPIEAPPAKWKLLGRTGRSPFVGFSRLKGRIDAASGFDNWCWHDLRRTARTGMAKLGVPRDHAEAAINHVSAQSAIERTYNRHPYDGGIIDALSRWQLHVAGLVRGSGTDIPRGSES